MGKGGCGVRPSMLAMCSMPRHRAGKMRCVVRRTRVAFLLLCFALPLASKSSWEIRDRLMSYFQCQIREIKRDTDKVDGTDGYLGIEAHGFQ